MKVFILLSVFAVAFAGDTECGPDSHYESCGTACPLTCNNYYDPPKACVLMCNPGCQCDEGFVKSIDGRCVRPYQCPMNATQCGPDSHYESCGTACPLTCDNYNDPPKACVMMCNPGCHCDEGFVKSFEGRCVRPYQCPMNDATQCDEGSHYESCGTACPLTCDNYADPPKACVLMCKPGCQCDEGLVKSMDGFCIRPFQCPLNATKCGPDSHYESCGTACPLTCDNYGNPPKACILRCNPGCHCDEGFVKSFEGRCVRPFQCPMEDTEKCGDNERYTKCGTACPLTCDNYNNPPKICPLMCKIGCECEDGFVRRSDGRCVRREECSSRTQSTEACDMPSETGVCRGFFPRFYFDRTTGQCQKFVYGGCGGNENNFETIEDCQQRCGVQLVPERCSLEAEVGLCFGYFPRYYYNKEKARCQKFIYGGCGGNENNFKTLEECQQTCVA